MKVHEIYEWLEGQDPDAEVIPDSEGLFIFDGWDRQWTGHRISYRGLAHESKEPYP